VSPLIEQVARAFFPFFRCDGIPQVVFPDASDLQVPFGRSFEAEPNLLDNSLAIRIARNDADFDPMEVESVEREAQHDHDCF
jgi:hypothetical protein